MITAGLPRRRGAARKLYEIKKENKDNNNINNNTINTMVIMI